MKQDIHHPYLERHKLSAPRFRGERLRCRARQGFALIATISVMVLLVMLALAMLSLSSTKSRQVGASSHQEIARANARFGMLLAMAELQRHAGPDRRVTANADILGNNVHAAKRHWLTVWDTSEWDVTNPVVSRDSKAYQATLVSRLDSQTSLSRSELESEMATAIPTSDDSWIPLVGMGSVSAKDDFVYAQRINISQENSSGAYAYWVGDEGVKARYDIAVADYPMDNAWGKIGGAGQPAGTGVHRMTGMESYTDYLGGPSVGDLDKMLDIRTLDLGGTPESANKQHFHNITTSHLGLLIDNRWGGIRRDLSTAFELDAAEFSELEEFNNSDEHNITEDYSTFIPNDVGTNSLYYSENTDPELGYLFEVPVDASLRHRGPTWDLLRNHYRIYKKERNALNYRGTAPPSDDALIAHGVVPFSYAGENLRGNRSLGSVWSGPRPSGGLTYQKPLVSAHGDSDRTQATVQKITPHVIRTILVYGMAREENEYFLTIDPYFVIHNPYNQPLEFHSISVDFNMFARMTRFKVNYTEEGTNDQKSTNFSVQTGDQKGVHSFRLKQRASGNNRLEPGEIKVMCVEAGREVFTSRFKNVALTSFEYNEGSGIYLGNVGKELNVKSGSVIEVESRVVQPSFIPTVYTRLLHPLKITGGQFDIEDPNTFTSINKNHDNEPITLIQNMRILPRTQDLSDENRQAANVSQIPHPDDGAYYMFAMDIAMKDFSGDVAVMGDFNPRAMGVDTRDFDADAAIAPNWEFEFKKSDLLGLQFVDANSNGYWGEGKTAADGGSTRVVLYDLPRAPISSLAALQHADINKLTTQAMHPIANSRIQIGQSDPTKIYNQLPKVRSSTPPKYQIDSSWAANEALWDRYYFTGINWGELPQQRHESQSDALSSLINGDIRSVLANPRMAFVQLPREGDIGELKDYRKIGKYLGVKGAFNVNSTSVEAWKAVLSGLSGRQISYLNNGVLTDGDIADTKAPLSRFTTPAGWDDDDYTGFRSLDEAEVESLAQAIVEQVKLRGPFMGLADFVNRRLVSDDTGLSGAVQAAIDESNINDSVKIGDTSGNSLPQSAPDANEGMARHLKQGDVLTSLAPILSTRSDTFVIRTYGESRDANDVIRAKAWCEVVVQRLPEWLVDTEEPSTVQDSRYPQQNPLDDPILRQWAPNENLPDSCKKFGRRFVIKSHRWLTDDEV